MLFIKLGGPAGLVLYGLLVRRESNHVTTSSPEVATPAGYLLLYILISSVIARCLLVRFAECSFEMVMFFVHCSVLPAIGFWSQRFRDSVFRDFA